LYQPLHRFILREVLALRRRRARLWTKSCVGRERLVAGTERAVSKRQNLQDLGETFPLLYMFAINCFGIEKVMCDLYLETQSLLFDTFIITVWYKLYRCDHSVLELDSFSQLMNWSNAPQLKKKNTEKNAPQARHMKKNAPQARFLDHTLSY